MKVPCRKTYLKLLKLVWAIGGGPFLLLPFCVLDRSRPYFFSLVVIKSSFSLRKSLSLSLESRALSDSRSLIVTVHTNKVEVLALPKTCVEKRGTRGWREKWSGVEGWTLKQQNSLKVEKPRAKISGTFWRKELKKCKNRLAILTAPLIRPCNHRRMCGKWFCPGQGCSTTSLKYSFWCRIHFFQYFRHIWPLRVWWSNFRPQHLNPQLLTLACSISLVSSSADLKFWKKKFVRFFAVFLTLGQVQLFSYFFFGPLTHPHTHRAFYTHALALSFLLRAQWDSRISFLQRKCERTPSDRQANCSSESASPTERWVFNFFDFLREKIWMKICGFFIKMLLQDLIQIRTQLWK